MLSLFILAYVLIVCYGVHAAPASLAADNRSLSIVWNLLQNDTTTSPGPFTSELVVTNNGQRILGQQGWQLYFNFCRKILPESKTDNFRIVHVNGDLFRLEPLSDFFPFRPGTSRTFRFQTESSLIKETDAPSGFFLVITDEVRQEKVVEPLGEPTVGPINSKLQTMRARDDQVTVPTPISRYQENLELLPASDQVFERIIPTPVLSKSLPGTTLIDHNTVIIAPAELKQEAAYLAHALEALLGHKLATHDEKPASANIAITLGIQDIQVAGQTKTSGDHAYRLTIHEDQDIAIVGTDPTGVFYGIQSLRAWLPIETYRQAEDKIAITAVEIEDAPRFGYRGMHLDVARNFQSVSSVKKLLELMAFYKLNKFHFHLTDDEGWRLAIRDLPELTEIGGKRAYTGEEDQALLPSFGSGSDAEAAESHGSGFYSREDFIDILRYAAERHIEVIPEIDLPGHSRAAIRAMDVRRQRLLTQGLKKEANEYLLHDPDDASQYESVQMWNDNVVNVCQESTFAFVKHVLTDIRSMYAEAGLVLKTIHLGGDEVPEGVWDDSPVCREKYQSVEGDPASFGKEAMADFFQRIYQSFSAENEIVTAAWEEVFLNDVRKSQFVNDSSRNRFLGPAFQCYVWNNVWGWGQEDVAYRLANAGVNVVLCNATHLYFDLAYNKDPQEPGYYWAGFVETKTAFSFAPLNYLEKTSHDIYGHPIAWESINRRVRLTEEGKQHILGIQGQLWGENLKGPERLEYMALPRLIALAERAWATEAQWIIDENPETWPEKFRQAWSDFARQLGSRELPRLDYLQGGFQYRIPDAGAVIEDGVLKANVAFPGLAIRYTTDGSEPDANSQLYTKSISVGNTARAKVFASNGRGGRSCTIQEQVFRVN